MTEVNETDALLSQVEENAKAVQEKAAAATAELIANEPAPEPRMGFDFLKSILHKES